MGAWLKFSNFFLIKKINRRGERAALLSAVGTEMIDGGGDATVVVMPLWWLVV